MNDQTLVRMAAVAAIAGGALRIADAFLADRFAAPTLAPLYFLTDLLLLGGTLGIYFARRHLLGWTGVAAVALTFVGLLIVRSDGVRIFGLGGYEVGAPLALFGTTLLGVLLGLKGHLRVSATLWLSALAIGIGLPCCQSADFTLFVAGALYGAGFIAAGASLLFTRPDEEELCAA